MTRKYTYRYPGSRPFDETEAKLFFGRDADAQSLYQLVLNEKTVLLYSKSGLGKSSLINAGLLPLLAKLPDIEIIQTRFNNYNPSLHAADDNLLNQKPLDALKSSICSKLANPATAYLDKIIPNENSLWYHLKRRQSPEGDKTFLFVFDQFEELLTYPEEYVFQFKKQLAQILFAGIPGNLRNVLDRKLEKDPGLFSEAEYTLLQRPIRSKALFAIRSDRMSDLNRISDFFPNLLKTFYELLPLSRQQAREAIECPAASQDHFISPPFSFEPKLLDLLLAHLEDKNSRSIESFQLQIVCQHIENLVIEKQLLRITEADIPNVKQIFENHYAGIIGKLPLTQQKAARVLIEDRLIIDGARVSMPIQFLIKEDAAIGMTEELLDQLLRTHIIRRLPNNTVEISHDTLIEPILKERDSGKSLLKQNADFDFTQGRFPEALEKYSDYLSATKDLKPDLKLAVLKNRADAYLKLGKPAEAIADYLEVLKLDPTDYQALYNIGTNYFELDQFGKGEDFLLRLGEQYPVYRVDALNEIGNRYFAKRRYVEARTNYEKAISIDKAYYYTYYNLGLIESEMDRPESAVQFFEKCLEINPDYVNARTKIVDQYYKLELFEDAVRHLQYLAKAEPNNVAAHFSLGFIAYSFGESDKARGYFLDAVQADPHHADSNYYLGVIEKSEGRIDEALRYLNRASEYSDTLPDVHLELGNIHYDRKDYEKARVLYEKALSINPNYEKAFYNLALIYENQGDSESAVKNLRKVIEIKPEDIKASKRLADILYKQEKYEEAIDHYEKVALLSPEAAGWNDIGRCHYALKSYDQAGKFYQKAIETDPSFYYALFNLGLNEAAKNNTDAALVYFHKALLQNPDYFEAHQEIADILLKSGSTDEALFHLKRITEIKPNDTDALNTLGNTYLAAKKYAEAEQSYLRSLEIDAHYHFAHFNLSIVYGLRGNMDLAVAHCKSAIAIAPSFTMAYTRLSELYGEQQRFEKAIECLEVAAKNTESKADVYDATGWLLTRRLEWEKARENFQKSLENDPSHLRAHLGLGYCLKESGDFAGAEELYRAALDINPNSEEAYYYIGELLSSRGNYNKALGYFETAIKLNPDYAHAYISLSDCYLKFNPFVKAEEISRLAIEREPSNPDIFVAYLNLAEAQANLGKLEEAEKNWEHASGLRPASDGVHYVRGFLYECRKNLEEAKAHYKKALALNPKNLDAQKRLDLMP